MRTPPEACNRAARNEFGPQNDSLIGDLREAHVGREIPMVVLGSGVGSYRHECLPHGASLGSGGEQS